MSNVSGDLDLNNQGNYRSTLKNINNNIYFIFDKIHDFLESKAVVTW